MPNDDHVAMLGRGAAVWNEWRAKHDEKPDLSGAGPRGLDLSGYDLSQADLRGALLSQPGATRQARDRCRAAERFLTVNFRTDTCRKAIRYEPNSLG
jgi:uncharacterized protein YjbI with pentapeptide repeats